MIDLDGGTFPNLPLMKLSAYHKRRGDHVVWYDGEYCDVVYMSKVFSFTPDYGGTINAGTIVRGGSGFAIRTVDGVEVYDKEFDEPLPPDVEAMFPDYSLYGITDTAYGFIQRGCPRACDFCHVKHMQGTKPYKVADLSDFWDGQPNIVLLDPNITSFHGWRDAFQQLIDSGATVRFSQGLDIRSMNREKIEMLARIKISRVHFAWDRYQDGPVVMGGLRMLKDITGWGRNKVSVYVLTNFDTSLNQDIERVMAIRELDFQPYVMRYDMAGIKRGSIANALARWVNFVPLFWKYETFEDYLKTDRGWSNERLLRELEIAEEIPCRR